MQPLAEVREQVRAQWVASEAARLAREARLWQRQQGSLWCVLLAGWLALLWGVVWLAERAGMH